MKESIKRLGISCLMVAVFYGGCTKDAPLDRPSPIASTISGVSAAATPAETALPKRKSIYATPEVDELLKDYKRYFRKIKSGSSDFAKDEARRLEERSKILIGSVNPASESDREWREDFLEFAEATKFVGMTYSMRLAGVAADVALGRSSGNSLRDSQLDFEQQETAFKELSEARDE